jgi:hypothetical protein
LGDWIFRTSKNTLNGGAKKAQQYPNEERNLEAAAILDRLAATMDAIPQDVFVAFSELVPGIRAE